MLVLLSGLLMNFTACTQQDKIEYGTGEWEFPIPRGRVGYNSLGTQRSVVKVAGQKEVVLAHLPWRRRDFEPENIRILVYDATSGEQITNVFRVNVNREYGDLVFQPKTVPGDYYLYYMPFTSTGGPYPKVTYDRPESLADAAWLEKYGINEEMGLSSLAKAELVGFEAISEFHSRYPMDIIATGAETGSILENNREKSFLLFTEDRKYPIRMSSDIPQHWIGKDNLNKFSGKADRNEYYAFQAGLMAVDSRIDDIEITYSDLMSGKHIIPATALTCFNKEGTNWNGKYMTKTVTVEKGRMHTLWFGIDIPGDVKSGKYTGTITVTPEGMESQEIELSIDISGDVLEDRGDSEPWKHSRLRWLNSMHAMNDELVKPFTPLVRNGNSIECIGRRVILDETGLPANIESYFSYELTGLDTNPRQILNAAMSFVIENAEGRNITFMTGEVEMVEEKAGVVRWKMTGTSGDIELTCHAKMELDGYVE